MQEREKERDREREGERERKKKRMKERAARGWVGVGAKDFSSGHG